MTFWQISNEPPNLPKFSHAKVLCYTVFENIIIRMHETLHIASNIESTKVP